jgi:hypothetical protein
MRICNFPVSGDWYCNKKGSSKIPHLATQGENGLGGIGYLSEDVTARESRHLGCKICKEHILKIYLAQAA